MYNITSHFVGVFVMTDLELFKQALDEAVSARFDRLASIGYREELLDVVREVNEEYIEEFKTAEIGEVEADCVTMVGDKHYFEFEKIDGKYKLVAINDIVYW